MTWNEVIVMDVELCCRFHIYDDDDDDHGEAGWLGQWFGNLRLDEILLWANTCR